MVTPFLTRPGRLASLALVAVLAVACAKDHEFFALVDDLIEGDIAARVTGVPGGAQVTVSGNGITESLVVGAAGNVFLDLPPGTYQVSVAAPQGYSCLPASMTIVLDEDDPDGVAEFACVADPGEISFSVAGLYSSDFMLPITLGGTATGQLEFGNGLNTVGDLGVGTLNWSLGNFTSHDCLPTSGSFNIQPGGRYDQSIECTPVKGKLRFEMSGLFSDDHHLQVQLSGATSGSLELGNGFTDLDDIDFGTVQWNATPLSTHACDPLSGNLVFLPGTDITVQIGCEPMPGKVTSEVSGTTAQVNYTGPVSGGAPVGETPVVFDNLPAGTYNFSIVEPDGFDCEPDMVEVELGVAGHEVALFTCEAEAEEELVEYSIDLQGFQGSPGAVAPGTYSRPVLDNLLNQVALMAIATIGAQTFYGTGPARLGFDGSSGYELDALFPVASLFFRLRALQVCTINAALSGSNFLLIQYYTAAAVLLGAAQITGSPGCFWLDVPATTRFVRMLGPAVGFVDIHGLLLRGILAP